MKNKSIIISLLFSLTLLLFCTQQVNAAPPGHKVGIQVDTLLYEFGNVRADGAPVVHEFTLINTGESAVSILSARASCGCTEPRYTRRPIMPGQSGSVTVKFIPAGQRGEVDKSVTLRLKNANGKTERLQLRLHGTVTPAQ